MTWPTGAPCGTISTPGLLFPLAKKSRKWLGIEFSSCVMRIRSCNIAS